MEPARSSTPAMSTTTTIPEDKMERFKKYYESLMTALHQINTQLQQSSSADLSPELVAQLQAKRKEIKSNLAIFLSKLQSTTNAASSSTSTAAASNGQRPDPTLGIALRQSSLDSLGIVASAASNDQIQLGAEARRFCCQVADRFITSVMFHALCTAKARGASQCSASDVAFALQRSWGIEGAEEAASSFLLPPPSKGAKCGERGAVGVKRGAFSLPVTEAHKLRMNQVKRFASMQQKMQR